MSKSYSIQELSQVLKDSELLANGIATDKLTRVYFDTRTIFLGGEGIFFALKGPHRDGHEFVKEAEEKGIRNFVLATLPDQLGEDCNYLIVADPLIALQNWASHHRAQFNYPVIAITGSNGKTIVKEWVKSFLGRKYRVVNSSGSYNSQIGVALSILKMAPNHELAIFEAGISRKGEMARLEKMLKPDIGVLTHMGDAHEEGFDNPSEKLAEKCVLFKGSKKVFCLESHAKKSILKKGKFEVVSVGKGETNSLQILGIKRYRTYSSISYKYEKQDFDLRFNIKSRAAVENLNLCALIALNLKVSKEEIVRIAARLSPVNMRMEIVTENPELTIINDAYNSDLGSIRNAFSLLVKDKSQSIKKVILTDMEGRQGLPNPHRTILDEACKVFAPKNISCIGPKLCTLVHDYPEIIFYASTEELIQNFKYEHYKGCTVLLKGSRSFRLETLMPYLSRSAVATTFTINLTALQENFKAFQAIVPPRCKIMAMVKAFSYGAGSWEIASELEDLGADYLAVAYLSEGIELRAKGIEIPIMVMNPDPASLEQLVASELEPEVFSVDFLEKVARFSSENNHDLGIHLKIESGMQRLGFREIDFPSVLRILKTNPQLKVISVFSHLAVADEIGKQEDTRLQAELFHQLSLQLIQELDYQPMRHLLNTAGILSLSDYTFDMVRLGIGLYGINPSRINSLPLHEIGTLKTYISQLRIYDHAVPVGYGHSEVIRAGGKIATIPIGYADGIMRSLSNGKGHFMIRGELVPIIGRVCMDMCMLDVTDIPEVMQGDEVLVFGESIQGNLPVETIAQAAGTISYEILSRISRRVSRVYVKR